MAHQVAGNTTFLSHGHRQNNKQNKKPSTQKEETNTVYLTLKFVSYMQYNCITTKMNTHNRLLITALMAIMASIGKVTCQNQCSNIALQANDETQLFTSPNYPQNYSSNENCQWILTATPSTSVVVLRVVDFNLEDDTSCTQDYVTIYDGNSITSNVIQKLCGQVTGRLYISLGRYMTITFRSNQAVTNNGFKFSYVALDKKNEYINSTITADETATFIMSPNYPNSYKSNVDRQHFISSSIPKNVIKLETLDFNVESFPQCTNNYVAIYDGNSISSPRLALLCGQIPANTTYFSTGSYMTLLYHSSNSLTSKLYHFQISSFNQSAQCANVALTATTVTQEFTSPNYPSNYSSYTDCQWQLTAVQSTYVIVLFLNDIALENEKYCSFDNVTIYDGNSIKSKNITTLCGKYKDLIYISSGQYMTVAFQSDQFITDKGFRFSYFSFDKSVRNIEFNRIATERSQFIASPNFPIDFQSYINCRWYLTTTLPNVIQLSVVYFYVNTSSTLCSDNYVAVYDGSSVNSPRLNLLCGQIGNSTYTSTGSSMTVAFHSSYYMSSSVFAFKYVSTSKPVACSSQLLDATTLTKYFTSPNYPSDYSGNADCVWYISASYGYVIYLSIEELKLEGSEPLCTYDYLAIYDGSSTYSSRIKLMCGTYSYTTYQKSSGSSLTVKFHSDASNNYKGFRIGYNSLLKSTSSSDVSSSSSSYSGIGSGGYTGVGLGTFFLICFLVSALTCTRRYWLKTTVTTNSNFTCTSNTTVVAHRQPAVNSAPQVQQHTTTNITEINLAVINFPELDTPLAPSAPRDSTLFTQAPMQPGASTDNRYPEAPPRYSDIINQ